MSWEAVAAAVLASALSGGLGVWVKGRMDRGKTRAEEHKLEADAASVLTEAAAVSVQLVLDRVQELEARVEHLNKMVGDLTLGMTALSVQLLQLGHEPTFQLRDGVVTRVT